MPKTLKIKTDRGVLAFGGVIKDTSSSNENYGKFGFEGTDLFAFFGFSPPFPSDWSDTRTATLTNGNRITFKVQCFRGSLKYHMEWYKNSTGELCYSSEWPTILNYPNKGDYPAISLVQTNGFKKKSLPGYLWQFGTACCKPEKDPQLNASSNKPPYSASTYPWAYVRTSGSVRLETQQNSIKSLYEFIQGSELPVFPGPDNEEDNPGGDGEGEVEDTPIEIPEAPGITVTDAGLMTLYTPTQGQIHAFGDFLWSDAFSLDTFKKLFADPMQAVIGLSIVPVDVPTAGAQPITIGAISSGVNANRAASQYVKKDCGTIAVNPVWNTALDFEPYTRFSIYLPFIGTRDLKTDDIMGKNVNVTYIVDVLSGACTAHISVNGSVLYQFSGSCATPVPLSSINWNNTITAMVQLAGAGIATALTGGAAAPAAAGMLTTAAGMVGNKPSIQRSGAVSGAAGMLGVKYPYLIRETPRQSLAKDYAHFSGYPSNITSLLGDLKGFTVVEDMHLKNIDATSNELREIESMLKDGVLL